MKICLAGEGAQGLSHMQVLTDMPGVEVASLAGGIATDTAAFAGEWQIPHHSLDLTECLEQDGVEAVILATPNQLHAAQAELALNMGVHVLVEIPMGLSLEEAQHLARVEEQTGLVCMVCHTKRYAPAFREVQRLVREGQLHLHHLVQYTYFHRRQNTNRHGKPRTWTDDLLWHQGCHMVDYAYWLFGEADMEVWAQAGPDHPTLGTTMDLTIGMRSREGCLVTSAMSFNNHGRIDGYYHFIGEENTYTVPKSGALVDWEGQETPLAGDALELQNSEFFAAIKEGREPQTSCRECLPAYGLLDRMQQSIDSRRQE